MAYHPEYSWVESCCGKISLFINSFRWRISTDMLSILRSNSRKRESSAALPASGYCLVKALSLVPQTSAFFCLAIHIGDLN